MSNEEPCSHMDPIGNECRIGRGYPAECHGCGAYNPDIGINHFRICVWQIKVLGRELPNDDGIAEC